MLINLVDSEKSQTDSMIKMKMTFGEGLFEKEENLSSQSLFSVVLLPVLTVLLQESMVFLLRIMVDR